MSEEIKEEIAEEVKEEAVAEETAEAPAENRDSESADGADLGDDRKRQAGFLYRDGL